MNRTLLSSALVSSLTIAIAGCSGKAASAPPPPPPAVVIPPPVVVPTAPVPAEDPAILASAKSGRIAGCFNTFSEELHELRDNYRSRVPERGPRRPEDVVAGSIWRTSRTYNLDSDGSCRSVARGLATTAPATPEFDAAIVAWVSALERLVRVGAEARPYFERKNYEDDGGARVLPLHRDLLAAFEAYFPAEEAFGHAMSGLETRANEARLAVLANDPARRVEFLVERSRGCTSRIGSAIADLELAEGRGARAFDVADPAAFFASIEECERWTNEMAAAPGIAGVSRFGPFLRDAQHFLTEAIVFGRKVRDRETFRREDDARDATNQMVDYYNRVVDSMNRM